MLTSSGGELSIVSSGITPGVRSSVQHACRLSRVSVSLWLCLRGTCVSVTERYRAPCVSVTELASFHSALDSNFWNRTHIISARACSRVLCVLSSSATCGAGRASLASPWCNGELSSPACPGRPADFQNLPSWSSRTRRQRASLTQRFIYALRLHEDCQALSAAAQRTACSMD